ncbi:hypothetical protein HELRODRAFT_166550 [Helobdella robusta]|uniref:Uncharacterized protein n=1 Tax=Helobdella robusta TaxID=6412 RepID=T1EY85_HELRO|nr:hypothetical protein HELRODRAFT_166550 [Helobdella robusta]ESO11549.1 hypothetical protein HELRODRAFT_166550 [Helobdella robusta]
METVEENRVMNHIRRTSNPTDQSGTSGSRRPSQRKRSSVTSLRSQWKLKYQDFLANVTHVTSSAGVGGAGSAHRQSSTGSKSNKNNNNCGGVGGVCLKKDATGSKSEHFHTAPTYALKCKPTVPSW